MHINYDCLFLALVFFIGPEYAPIVLYFDLSNFGLNHYSELALNIRHSSKLAHNVINDSKSTINGYLCWYPYLEHLYSACSMYGLIVLSFKHYCSACCIVHSCACFLVVTLADFNLIFDWCQMITTSLYVYLLSLIQYLTMIFIFFSVFAFD